MSSITRRFFSSAKYSTTERATSSPISWTERSSSSFASMTRVRLSKWAARTRATCWPTFAIPSPYRKRSRGAFFEACDRLQQVLRGLLREALELEDVLLLEAVEIGKVGNQPPLHQLGHRPRAQIIDLHRATAPEMLNASHLLRPAAPAAACRRGRRLSTPPSRRRPDSREGIWNCGGSPCAVIEEHLDDLGNHVSRALDAHPVADPDVLPPDFILVVKRRAAHRDPGDVDGPEERDRGELPRPAHGDGDVHDFRDFLPRGELESDRPAGAPRARSELRLLIPAIDLDHDSVELVVELVALRFELPVKGDDVVESLAEPARRVDAKPPIRRGCRAPPSGSVSRPSPRTSRRKRRGREDGSR